MTTRTWQIDTNAGPIVRHHSTEPACKRYIERMIPLLAKRGYSCTWTRNGEWRVITISNSKGRVVHSAAFRPLPSGVAR